MISSLLIGLLLLVTLTICGVLVAKAIVPGLARLELVAIGFPLGAGLIAGMVFCASMIGIHINEALPLGLVLAVVAISSCVIWLRTDVFPLTAVEPGSGGWSPQPHGWLYGAAAGLLLVLSVVAVANSYSTWDAMAIWSVKGYGIVAEGSFLAGQEWGTHGLSYPLQLPILIGLFRLFTGEVLPSSKTLFPMYFGSILLCSYAILGAQVRSRGLSAAGTAFVASIPILVEHSTIGYANLPLTALILLASYFMAVGWDGTSLSRLILSGMLYGLAIWMRPEAVYLVPITVIAFVIKVSGGGRQRVAYLIPFILTAAIGVGWLAFSSRLGRSIFIGTALGHALEGFKAGDMHLSAIYQIVRFMGGRLVDIHSWGLVIFLLAPAPVLLWVGRKFRKSAVQSVLLTTSLSWGLPVLVFYYLLSFDSAPLIYWLSAGLERLLLPAAVTGVVWVLVELGSHLETGISGHSANPTPDKNY